MNSIRQTIKELCNPTEEQLEEICSALTPKELKKGQFLLSEGQVCRQYYFLEQGTLRLFYNKGSNEFTVWMGTSGEVFTNLESYLPEEPSRINIKAIEPAKIYLINKKDSDQLASKSNTYNTLLRKTVEIAFVNLSKNVMSFQSDEASERYQRLASEKDWLKKYPLKYISSFLGITQSSLSRIRAKKK